MSCCDRWHDYCKDLEDKLADKEKKIQVLQGLILFMTAAPGKDRVNAYKQIMVSLDLDPELIPAGVEDLP